MKLFAALTELFLQAFQISRPRPEQRRRAEWIIGGSVLAAILLAASVLIGMLVWAFRA